ncbi:AAA family ATPase [Burkholderia pseudomallei]|nr:ATP-binding protein [Burkholderia pseudomallei]MBF3619371.1 ATP-binding protein [Burkholderia pseudomallei]
MKVCYLGRRSARRNPAPQEDGDVIELLWDNWDDYGYKTSFATTCRLGGKLVDIGVTRLLIGDLTMSVTALDELRKAGWDGTFPAPGLDYISVPQEITFYQQVKAHLGGAVAMKVARALRDASLLVRSLDGAAQKLVATEGFKNSLQRERGSVTAYLDGWKVLEDLAIAVQDFNFNFRDVYNAISTLTLNFDAAALLPHDINVMIGPNGVGKSRVLHQMVQCWTNPDHAEEEAGFAEQPNLSQIAVVSYSPFERFPVDMDGISVQDKDIYRYFGFRGRSGEARRIRISHEFPKITAAQSLVACLADDQKYKAIEDWARKVSTVETVLRTAFQFDFAAVEVESGKRVRSLYADVNGVTGDTHVDLDGHRYVPIATHTMNHANPQRILEACVAKSGVAFFKDGTPIELSSGQRLFAYIVIDLLGAIRRNSLILIDEPELFLHPTLEIQFLEMLKEILANFNSKALLATHSEVIVREVPADCVHVFERTDDGLVIKHPPFQTFGGDIQRISSYVFGDNAVSKPFEKWLKHQLEEHGSAKSLIDALGDNLNEELLVQIKSMDDDNVW